MQKKTFNCLIIVGMHRSGTSLTASLLQKAGLNIGEKLLAANIGNEFGHFENEDFYEFHKEVLTNHNCHSDGWDLQSLQDLNLEEKKIADKIIADNQTEQWGWKDPRTTLFLEFWKRMIPDANFLFVYRKPWEVVDSLFRRNNDDVIIANPSSAFQVWDYYNQEILSFFKLNKEKSILIDIENVINETHKVIDLLNAKFGLSLQTDFSNSFNTSKFINDANPIGKIFSETVFPKSISLFEQLQKESTLIPSKVYQPTHTGLERTTNWWYNSAQNPSNHKKMVQLNEQIDDSNKQINNLNLQIHNLNNLTDNLNSQINSLNTHLNQLINELDWITNSKWWKLRSWFK